MCASTAHYTPFVMAGLVPAIHVFLAEDVDARVKPGHDE
jgi:hypothetical protein